MEQKLVRADGDSLSYEICWLKDKHTNEFSLLEVSIDNNNKKMNFLPTSQFTTCLPNIDSLQQSCWGRYYYLTLDKESEVQGKLRDLTNDDKAAGFRAGFPGSLLNGRPIHWNSLCCFLSLDLRANSPPVLS